MNKNSTKFSWTMCMLTHTVLLTPFNDSSTHAHYQWTECLPEAATLLKQQVCQRKLPCYRIGECINCRKITGARAAIASLFSFHCWRVVSTDWKTNGVWSWVFDLGAEIQKIFFSDLRWSSWSSQSFSAQFKSLLGIRVHFLLWYFPELHYPRLMCDVKYDTVL